MKIALDISQIVYQTGVSRYTEQLVRSLLELDKKNTYLLYGGSLRQKKALESFVAQIKRPKVKSLITNLSPTLADFFWNRWRLLSPDKWLGKLDIFHASNWALPKTSAKLVTTIHDLTFLKYPKSLTPKIIKAQTRHLKLSKKHADMIIAVSLATKLDLIEYGIPEDKLVVIYEAPAEVFKPVTSLKKIKAVKQKFKLKKPFILSVGTLEPRKNLKKLIQAYSQLNLKNVELNIVGKFGWGPETKAVPGVNLLGFVSDEDLAVLYSIAKVFVYPSLYEGFGLPILEAFACGCPVITSKTSSLPELGGQAAIYVNPRQTSQITKAIKQVLDLKKENRAKLKSLGLKQVKMFSWEKAAQKTLQVYERLYADRN